ncbi:MULTISPECIES: dTDP-4-dehydrorhamnose reductase [Weissella]|uniref:dTDP-4-dehydrorhamnose reductase n=1 Tax=Weissella TaxID=46255 RepID=UPI0021B019C3|nr:dTDP-4-dehydrorhamnose reductase [Weissella cibaria]MCS8561641.1 dTDP-4-dehydrorhamnose reductase [Weissella cibaria]MCS8564884.1 dTDP-4-dehydrorhamnose reductase [Weissella cibaria]MCS8575383.1 dTDP-4-dehydrorhamnose reductase [Weissella cibaria]
MKYLVVGANGQLGQELVKLLRERQEQFVAFDSRGLDITNRSLVFEVFETEKPDVILDAAAYTAVDAAEDEGKELNWSVNADGSKNLADAAKFIGAKLVFVSTDYVFSGAKKGMYLESDPVEPKNEYGKAKLAGERAIQASGVQYYVVRTSWVFGEFGNNFVHTMQKLGKKLEKLTVVDDQKGRPTWTRTLAEFMMHLIKVDAEQGVYNLSNDGEASWYEFAKEILRDEEVDIEPVSSNEFPTKAYRPANSVLHLGKAKSTGFEIPSWQDALHMFEASDHQG